MVHTRNYKVSENSVLGTHISNYDQLYIRYRVLGTHISYFLGTLCMIYQIQIILNYIYIYRTGYGMRKLP